MAIGGGFDSQTSAPPFQVELRLLPVAFMRLARMPEVQWRNERGVLTGSASNVVLRADARTGRLIELRFDGGSDDWPFALSRVHLARVQNQRAGAGVVQGAGGHGGIHQSSRPGSPVEFGAGLFGGRSVSIFIRALNDAHQRQRREHRCRHFHLGKLVDRDLFAAWEHCFSLTNATGEDSVFLIPQDSSSSNPLDFVAAWILGNSGELVAPDSWVADVLCEKALGVSRRADQGGRAWEHLYSSAEADRWPVWRVRGT